MVQLLYPCRVLQVKSPGIGARLQDGARADDLEDMALAARYKSLLEEHVLRVNRGIDVEVDDHSNEREV